MAFQEVLGDLTETPNIGRQKWNANDLELYGRVADLEASTSGGLLASPVSISSDTTAAVDEDVYLVDASGGNRTLTLPSAVGRAGKVYWAKKIDSSPNSVIVDGSGTETIDGATTVTTATQYDAVGMVSDGVNWHVITPPTGAGVVVAHAATHVNGTDDIQNATASQKGLATAAQIAKLDGMETAATADQVASEVPFTPTGTVAATNVQAAIAEVASEASAAANYRTLVRLGSDLTNSTATLADVTGLSFPITSGVIYHFHFRIIYESQSTATGTKFALNGPGTPTGSYNIEHHVGGSAVKANVWNSSLDLTTTGLTVGNLVYIDGWVSATSSGTVIARFASEAPGTNNQITVKAGSTVEYW